MARLPEPGGDTNTWGEVLNEFLNVEHNSDGTLRTNGTIASKADDSLVVHKSGSETITGTKTFSNVPIVPAPSNPTDVANKQYVDGVAMSGAPNATTSTNGLIRLAGDLGGVGTVAAAPVISAGAVTTGKIAAGAVTSNEIADGTITNADISTSAAIAKSKLAALAIVDADVSAISSGKISGLGGAATLNVGTTAGTVAAGNDARITGAVQSTRLISTSTGLTGGGDLSADRTLSVTNDSTTQKVRVSKAGVLTGTRQEMNLIEGSNVSITTADNSGSNRVDVTVATTGVMTTAAALGYVDVVTGSETRPANARVIWIGGTTQPTNMDNLDVWLKAA